MRLEAVLFDIGGTLIDYPSLESLRETCETHWKEIGVDRKVLIRMYEIYMNEREAGLSSLKEAVIFPALASALQEFGLSVSTKKRDEIIQKLFHFHLSKNASLYSGASELLQDLKALRLSIGLISNTPFVGKLHEQDLERFGILSYFGIRIWSSEFGKRKPHPDIFKEAIKRLRIKPKKAVYIGDQISRDVEGPTNIGMPAIWINRRGEQNDFSGLQVDNLEEVMEMLDSFS